MLMRYGWNLQVTSHGGRAGRVRRVRGVGKPLAEK